MEIFYLTSITGDYNRPYTNILIEINYLKGCPQLGKRDNKGLSLNGAKKEGGRCHPLTKDSQKTPYHGENFKYIRNQFLPRYEAA